MRFALLLSTAFIVSSSAACLKKNKQFHQGGARVAPKEASENAEAKGTEQGDDEPSASGSTAKNSSEPVVEPLSDAEAIAYVKEACVACHDSQKGAVASFWALRTSELSAASLATDELAANVYYSLLTKSRGLAGGIPAPMPPEELKGDALLKLKRLVRWFEVEMPAVVVVARAKFQGAVNDPQETGILLSYECREPLTLRSHLTQLTNDFFDRPPVEAELASFGEALDKPVTEVQRETLARRLFDDAAWNQEFETKALRKFADKLSGASEIKSTAGISVEQAEDLKSEFYRLLLTRYKTTPYRDILLTDVLPVSDKTSALYGGCRTPDAGQWVDCKQQAPRGSYFASLSFLLSRPSSFLTDNNNYGRAKLLHFFVSGDVFKSAFDGASGDKSVRPLPECLKTKDWRGLYNADKTHVAPYGTASVPATGNLCQSCHIARHMAAGSLVFRPYAPSGLIYEKQTPVRFDPLIEDATSELHVYKNSSGRYERVTVEYLVRLLEDKGEQACAVQFGDATPPVVIATVSDLAKVLIGDGRILASGLARHVPRAMSNKAVTTEELVIRIMTAFSKSGGLLKDAFQAYAASETYSCKAGSAAGSGG